MPRIAGNSARGFRFLLLSLACACKDRSRTGRKPVTGNKPKLIMP
jgi:hypothetical protein